MGKKYESHLSNETFAESEKDAKRKKVEYFICKLKKHNFDIRKYEKQEYLNFIDNLIKYKEKKTLNEQEPQIIEKIFQKKEINISEDLLTFLFDDSNILNNLCNDEMILLDINNKLKVIFIKLSTISSRIETNKDYKKEIPLYNTFSRDLIYLLKEISKIENRSDYFVITFVPNLTLWIYDFFDYNLSNIYFKKLIPPNTREDIYNCINSNLEDFKNIIKNFKIDNKIKLKTDIVTDFYCFLSTKIEINKKQKLLDMELSIIKNLKKYTNMHEKEFLTIKDSKINPRDIKLSEKKDNQFNKKIENFKKLIHILNEKDDGIILSHSIEHMKILYNIIYAPETLYKKKKLYSLLNFILNNHDTINIINDSDIKEKYFEYLDYFNLFFKKQIFFENNKSKELKWSYDILKVLLEIYDEILKINSTDIIVEKFLELIQKIFTILEDINSTICFS